MIVIIAMLVIYIIILLRTISKYKVISKEKSTLIGRMSNDLAVLRALKKVNRGKTGPTKQQPSAKTLDVPGLPRY